MKHSRILTLHVDVDILIHISDGVGGVAAVVSGVLLHQVGDDDGVSGDLAPRVRLGLFYRQPIVDPGDLRRWRTGSLATNYCCFSFGLVEDFGLHGEEWCRCKKIFILNTGINCRLSTQRRDVNWDSGLDCRILISQAKQIRRVPEWVSLQVDIFISSSSVLRTKLLIVFKQNQRAEWRQLLTPGWRLVLPK